MAERTVNKSDQISMMVRLRQATEEVHRRLHQHPLMLELMERPSRDNYKTVLLRFLRFYSWFEPRLVRDARLLGFSTLYPRQERIQWLIADLGALEGDLCLNQSDSSVGDTVGSESAAIGDLVGRLYVVRGSALGGRRVLTLLRGGLEISDCCQFFNAGGAELVASNWCDFQKFCDRLCLSAASRSSAAESAQSAFCLIEHCLR